MDKRIIVISGPSGAGKTTLCAELLKTEPRIKLCVTATSRPPRPDEVNGRDYFFIAKSDFETGIAGQEFIEYVRLFDAYYGTPKKSIEDIWQKGCYPLLRIDVHGARTLKKLGYQGIFIFILPPSPEVLKERLKKRDGSNANFEKRLAQARQEIQCQNEYDFRVVNDKLEEATTQIKLILENSFFSEKKKHEGV